MVNPASLHLNINHNISALFLFSSSTYQPAFLSQHRVSCKLQRTVSTSAHAKKLSEWPPPPCKCKSPPPRGKHSTLRLTHHPKHRPTRLRTHIRDHITSPTSAVSVRTSALTTTLGYPVDLDPEWAMLWKTLQPRYPDQATFIPSIANVLVTWCDAFTAWLEGEENEEDVEKLLDDLMQRGRVEIVLEVRNFLFSLLPLLDE